MKVILAIIIFFLFSSYTILGQVGQSIEFPRKVNKPKDIKIIKQNAIKTVYEYNHFDTTKPKILQCVLKYNSEGCLTDSIIGFDLLKGDTMFVNKILTCQKENQIMYLYPHSSINYRKSAIELLKEKIPNFNYKKYKDNKITLKILNKYEDNYLIKNEIYFDTIPIITNYYDSPKMQKNEIPIRLYLDGHFIIIDNSRFIKEKDDNGNNIYIDKQTSKRLIAYKGFVRDFYLDYINDLRYSFIYENFKYKDIYFKKRVKKILLTYDHSDFPLFREEFDLSYIYSDEQKVVYLSKIEFVDNRLSATYCFNEQLQLTYKFIREKFYSSTSIYQEQEENHIYNDSGLLIKSNYYVDGKRAKCILYEYEYY